MLLSLTTDRSVTQWEKIKDLWKAFESSNFETFLGLRHPIKDIYNLRHLVANSWQLDLKFDDILKMVRSVHPLGVHECVLQSVFPRKFYTAQIFLLLCMQLHNHVGRHTTRKAFQAFNPL